MGYNQHCIDQDCQLECCNSNGYCPDTSSVLASENSCWYNYQGSCSRNDHDSSSSQNCCYSSSRGYYPCDPVNVGVIVGSIIGAVAGTILLIVIIVCICKKYRQPPPAQTSAGGGGSLIILQPGQPQYQMPNTAYPPAYYGAPGQNPDPYSIHGGQPYNMNNLNAPYIVPNNVYPQK